jgi:hypothetical protein
VRDLEILKGVEPRYDSCVIASTAEILMRTEAGESAGGFDAAEPSGYQGFLKTEDFSNRAPPNTVSTVQKGVGPFPSVLDYHEAYKTGRSTPLEVVEKLLPLVKRSKDGSVKGEGAGKHAVAFLSSKADIVRKAAEESSLRWKEGKQRGILDGVVIVSILSCQHLP